MYVYSDEDNAPMTDDYQIEYTGVINDKLFKQTGECTVRRTLTGDDKQWQIQRRTMLSAVAEQTHT